MLPFALLLAAQGEPPRVTSVAGELRIHEAFPSKILGRERAIRVWLPPGYDTGKRRYPVQILLDGQNVFDGMTSYIPNQEWRADETAKGLIEAGALRPMILVGVDNAGMERGNEYLPTKSRGMGGDASKFGRFLTDELLPFLRSRFRTLNGPRNTGLLGSSFGGVATVAIGLERPDVFGRLGVFSPSVWWDGRELLKRVDRLADHGKGQRVYVDVGGDGPEDARALADRFVARGWRENRDLLFFRDEGAPHSEISWARRLPTALTFLWR